MERGDRSPRLGRTRIAPFTVREVRDRERRLQPDVVPAEILVYTREEWDRLRAEGGRFARSVEREARWLVEPG
jgi:hypothetical protein